MHDCTDLDRTLESVNNKHTFYCTWANIILFSLLFFIRIYVFVINSKSISKMIEFLRHIGKILTLRYNQSNVCYVRSRGHKLLFGYKVQMYIYTRAHIYRHNYNERKWIKFSNLSFFFFTFTFYNICLLFDIFYTIEY